MTGSESQGASGYKVAMFVRVENILNKVNFVIGGFNNILEFVEGDKGYISGGIDILEEIHNELASISKELKQQPSESPTPAEIKNVVFPQSNKVETPPKPHKVESVPPKNLPHVPTMETPKPLPGFNTIAGLDKLKLPHMVNTSEHVLDEHPIKEKDPTNIVHMENMKIEDAAPPKVTHKLTEVEASLSIIEVDILECLLENRFTWISIGNVCKNVHRARATVSKHIRLLFDKGFTIYTVSQNKKGNITGWKLSNEYQESIDKLKFIIELCKK